MASGERCPLCNGTKTSLLFSKEGIQRFTCETCFMVFSQSHDNPNFQEKFSDFEFSYQQYLRPSLNDSLNHAQTLNWVEGFVKLKAAMTCIDVGCSSGGLLRYFQEQRPAKFIGLEPSRALFETFHSGKSDVRCETLPEYAKAHPSSLDVVLLLDMIEHVQDIQEFGRALKQVLKPGGFVFISTPDSNALLAKVLGKNWHHFNKYHLSVFAPATLKHFAATFGLEMLECGSRSKLISSEYLVNYLAEFIFRRKLQKLIKTPNFHIRLNLGDIQYCVMRDSGVR